MVRGVVSLPNGNGKTMKVENADLTAVNDSMKPGKIKQLFSKSMKGRIISRTLLNKFIDEVAQMIVNTMLFNGLTSIPIMIGLYHI